MSIDRCSLRSVELSLFGVWRSPVARLLWEQDVEGSNPFTPTTYFHPPIYVDVQPPVAHLDRAPAF